MGDFGMIRASPEGRQDTQSEIGCQQGIAKVQGGPLLPYLRCLIGRHHLRYSIAQGCNEGVREKIVQI